VDLIKDEQGNIWGVTSTNGLFKFDGKNFYFFGPKQKFPQNIGNIQIDKKGIFWMSGLHEIISYDGKNITYYKIPYEMFTEGIIKSFHIDANKICWIVQEDQLIRMDIEKESCQIFGQAHGLPNSMINFVVDKKGNLWIGSKDGFTIIEINGNSEQGFTTWHYGKDQGFDPDPEKSEYPYSMSKAGEDHIWLLGITGCTKLFNPHLNYSELEYLKIGDENNLPTTNLYGRLNVSYVFSIIQQDESNYLVSSPGNSIIKLTLNKTEGKYLTYEGLSSTAFKFSDQSNIWGFNGPYGLIVISKNPYRAKLDHPIGNTKFLRTAEDKWGRMWFGTYGSGVYRYLPPKVQGDSAGYLRYYTKHGMSSDYVDGFHADKKGNLWVGTRTHGLIKMELDSISADVTIKNYRSKNGLPADVVPDICEDSNGDIWFSTFEFGPQDTASICRVRGAELLKIGKAQGLSPRGDGWSITADKVGGLWAAIYGRQSLVNFKKPLQGKNIDAREFNGLEFLNGVLIKDLLTDSNGDTWVAVIGGDGLIQVKKELKDSIYQIQHYTVEHGLASNSISSLLEDFNGDIWIGTSSGISKMININKGNQIEKKFINYSLTDGLSGGAYEGSLFQGSDSTIYSSSPSYSFAFKPKDLMKNFPKPVIQLNRILLFDKLIPWHIEGPFLLNNDIKIEDYTFDSLSNWNNLPQNLSLRHSNNFISFDFTGVNVNQPNRIQYAYMLEGVDDRWTESTEAFADFNRLSPGNYTFKVKAKHEQGEYGEIYNYPFQIRPPWYKTKLAFIVYGLLTLALVYAFVKDRIRRVVEKIKLMEEIRRKISADLHDDVGSILTGIAMQAEYLATKQPEDIEPEMKQLSTRSREAMDKMRDIVWAMDARKDKMINLVDKMRYFAELSFENSNFNFDLRTKLKDKDAFIHPLVRQHVYLIFKEAVTNILKHSNGDQVKISLRENTEKLFLVIQDNGAIKALAKSEGAGLSNIKERVNQIKGELSIDMKKGFLINIILPKNPKGLSFG